MELAPPGTWTLDRRVLDRRLGRSGCVHGQLLIGEGPDGQDWSESGTLTWAGSTIPVSRLLLLRRLDGAWWMHFADGAAFHPWRPGCEVVHDCGADTYRGRIALSAGAEGRARMRIVWAVTGPDKDQLLSTRLRHVRRPALKKGT